MNRGRRIYFDEKTGEIIIDTGEATGDILELKKYNKIDYIDIPFGQDTEKYSNVKAYHVNTSTKQVVFDELNPKVETEEEKLKREKSELENQLLLQADKNLGGIL